MPILYYMSTIFIFFSTKIVTQNSLLSVFAAVIFNLIPGITFSSFVATTDVPLIFFSSGFTFLFLTIYKKRILPIFIFFF